MFTDDLKQDFDKFNPLESVMITPKAFTVTNADLMTQKTLAMREGSNLGYIGNYIGAYIAL